MDVSPGQAYARQDRPLSRDSGQGAATGARAGARRIIGTLLLLGAGWTTQVGFTEAHDPTVGNNEYPLQGGGSYQEEFDWHGTYTPPSAWFQDQFELAAETWWETGNATRGPQFTLDTGLSDNYIEYRPWPRLAAATTTSMRAQCTTPTTDYCASSTTLAPTGVKTRQRIRTGACTSGGWRFMSLAM